MREGWPHSALPSLSNAVGYFGDPELATTPDGLLLPKRKQSRRTYEVFARGLPTIAELMEVKELAARGQFARERHVPELPGELVSFLATFQGGYWQRFDAWRNWVLDNVVAARLGEVSATPASRIAEMFSRRRATPFELVALQVVGARWMGIPTRLVFGYDGGDSAGNKTLHIDTELHAAFWMEVHFGDFGWVPVIGTPKRADGDDC